jgi:hypothetical protein
MTDKSIFTPDEWKLLLESVMAAGIAVSAAEPSGLWGLLLCQRQCAVKGQDGLRGGRADQGGRR